ncbi:unnamed protein product [Rangifer tarandus platyrhynchus]|uniref:Uncharacterized protein n=2 Tax=Rangifer tarandus platyrhynchus TaxID=3082113 RepID=A0ABN8ZHI2_RANTA|nr:unnamed protein product [Rangifer tarandus platyrhynchus]
MQATLYNMHRHTLLLWKHKNAPGEAHAEQEVRATQEARGHSAAPGHVACLTGRESCGLDVGTVPCFIFDHILYYLQYIRGNLLPDKNKGHVWGRGVLRAQSHTKVTGAGPRTKAISRTYETLCNHCQKYP